MTDNGNFSSKYEAAVRGEWIAAETMRYLEDQDAYRWMGYGSIIMTGVFAYLGQKTSADPEAMSFNILSQLAFYTGVIGVFASAAAMIQNTHDHWRQIDAID